MPDQLNSDGLQVKTLAEIREELEENFKATYGQDINLDQNSPDGQIVNIFSQAGVDIRELIQEVFNSFDPDAAQGTVLDQRVAINNIQRRAGTFTLVDVEVTVDRSLTLQGLDANFNDVNGTGFTLQDASGNQFILVDTTAVTAGTTTLSFRAQNIGEVNVLPSTITQQVTVVVGVTDVDNPSGPTQVGQDEETDAQLRFRRQNSVANASFGVLDGIQGLILNLEGVTDAKVYENFTDTTDADGIPPHAIWAVVEGGANSDIAQTIYERKSTGANMRGTVEVTINSPAGLPNIIKFDRPTNQDLYISFDLKATAPSQTFDQAAIKQNIVDALTYRIGESAETALITQIAKQAVLDTGAQGTALNVLISDDDISYVEFLDPPTIDAKFVLDVARITITEI